MAALGPPGDHADPDDDHAHDERDVAVEDLGGVDRGDRREERPAHQRPVREDEGRVRRGRDVRAEQEQGVARHRPEGSQEGEPLARAAAADVGRVEAPGQDEDEQAEEGHRAREVGRHRLAAVAEPDGLFAEPRLEADEDDRRDPEPEERAPIAVVAPGEDRQAEDQDPEDRGDVAVQPFEPGLHVTERRDHLALAQRPIGAAQAGIGGTDDDADRDQQKGRRDRHGGELLEPGHQASANMVARGSAAAAVVRGAGRRAAPILAAPCPNWRRPLRSPGCVASSRCSPPCSSRPAAARAAPPAPSSLVVGGSGGPSVLPAIFSSETVVGAGSRPDRPARQHRDDPDRHTRLQGERRLHRSRQGQEHVRDRARSGELRVGNPQPAGRLVLRRDVQCGRQLVGRRDRDAARQAGRVIRARPAGEGDRHGDPGRGHGPIDANPDQRDRRRRPRQHHDRPEPRSALLRALRGRGPGPAQAVRPRLRHPGVLHEPGLRPDARRRQGRRQDASPT